MRIKNYIPGLVTFILIFSGCQSLDQEIITDLNYDQVTSSYDMTKYRCASVYATIPSGFQLMGNAMMSSVTDESEHTNETSSVQVFNTGSVNPYNNPDNVWGDYFTGIRKANQFLASSDSVDLDLYKFDPAQQTVYISRSAEIKNWKYEVRFLRAYFYFELIKRYGGLPILTTAGPIDGDYSNIERNSLAECIKFIVDECDSAAAVLPLKYTLADDLGRITKGAALALKSRMLLYAASDLYNDPSWAQGYSKPELISISGDRQDKWKSAADAAKAVIDIAAASGLSLSNNYGSLFGPTTHTNAEVLFCRRYGSTNAFEIQNTPIGYDKGKSGTTPSQNLIDDYEVKVNATTAVAFDWSNPNHSANPYATSGPTARDPRLSFTVLTNNAIIKGRPVETFIGGLDGQPIYQATKTGYYLRKYNNTDLNLTTGTSSVHSFILIRLAEVYLNYAEALNEYSPGNPDIKLYVDKVRQRTSVVMPPLPAGLNQEQMREAIRHERRIELAFEDHRYWDLKRWMTAPAVLNQPLKGVEISKNADLSFSYKIINVENRVFEPKMYFYPIPRSELFITQWDQNPLW